MPLAQPHRQRVGDAAPADVRIAVTLQERGASVDAVARALRDKRDRVVDALAARGLDVCVERQRTVSIAPVPDSAAGPGRVYEGSFEVELRVPGAADPLAVISGLPEGIVAGVRELDGPPSAAPADDAPPAGPVLRRPPARADGCDGPAKAGVTRPAPGS
jgi:hypothetical protein